MEPVSQVLTCTVDAQLAMAGSIFSGVLDRFPELRVSLYESNVAWLPAWLCKIYDHVVGRQAWFIEGHKPSQKPSQISAGNVS